MTFPAKFPNRLSRIVQGDTWQWQYRIKNSLGVYTDFTGNNFKMQIRDAEGNLMFTYQTPSSGISISTTTATITVPASDTATLSGVYFFDLQYTVGSAVTTVVTGKIVVTPDVTA
jgi:hypothetical protein